jgi:hypothetical protein
LLRVLGPTPFARRLKRLAAMDSFAGNLTAELGSPTRRSLRNAVDDDASENLLAARLARGEDPQLLWSAKPLGRRMCEEIAELEPEVMCKAVTLNSHTHPTLASLLAAHALKDAAKAQRGRNAGVAEKLGGALRA